MKVVFPDLSGAADLYRDAFPAERAELVRAIAAAACKVNHRETTAGLSVQSYEVEDADFERVVAPWQERLTAVVELNEAALLNTRDQWVMVKADLGFPVIGLGLLQARIKTVVDSGACGGPILCLESLEDGSLHVRQLLGKIDARRPGSDEYVHGERARGFYAEALERSAPSSELAHEKVQLILGSDNPRTYDVMSWYDVVGAEDVAVLTDEMVAGFGHPGRNRTLYRVRERDGSSRLVIEQVLSRKDGYTVKYDWVQDIEGSR